MRIEKPKPEMLEKELKFHDAGLEYLKKADSIQDISLKIDYLMKASKCFELSQPWHISFHSWQMCGAAILTKLENSGCNIPSEIKFKNLNSDKVTENLSVYGLSDEKWKFPEKDRYSKLYSRLPNEEEIEKHRLAWVYDFAGQSASRNGEHSDAASMYEMAAKAWLSCQTFPTNELIAAKFLTYSICERILGMGLKNFNPSERLISNNLIEIENITLKRKEFHDYAKNSERKDNYYKILASYFRAIITFAGNKGLKEIQDRTIILEHKTLRYYYSSTRKIADQVKRLLDLFFYCITGNGTNWLKFALFVIFIALVLFPPLYYFCFKCGVGNINPSNDSSPISLYKYFYFSIVTLTTLGYGDYYPTGLCMLLATLEAAFGYIILGIFIWLLTRRLS